MKTIAVIPARLHSTRLPGKVLRKIRGEPLLVHVARRVGRCKLLDRTVVATGDAAVESAMQAHGIEVVRTPRDLPSGSDRIAVVNAEIGADVVVNIQGDEPLVEGHHVTSLIELLKENPWADVSTLRFLLAKDEWEDPNSVKVVTDRRGAALYFSRQPLAQGPGRYYKHLGMYAFRRETLALMSTLPPSPQELAERLEQLRLLDAGVRIAVGDALSDTISVDTSADLRRVRRLFNGTVDPDSRV